LYYIDKFNSSVLRLAYEFCYVTNTIWLTAWN